MPRAPGGTGINTERRNAQLYVCGDSLSTKHLPREQQHECEPMYMHMHMHMRLAQRLWTRADHMDATRAYSPPTLWTRRRLAWHARFRQAPTPRPSALAPREHSPGGLPPRDAAERRDSPHAIFCTFAALCISLRRRRSGRRRSGECALAYA
jgi:hypothetical protein